MGYLYADASALVKLVLDERESDALRTITGATTVITSELAHVEVAVAARRNSETPERHEAARRLFDGIMSVPMDSLTLERAGFTSPVALRALDAIHYATIERLVGELDAVACYDKRLSAAVERLGVPVITPGV